ncbi:5658_t:CDS:2, partial [Racocetra persica]
MSKRKDNSELFLKEIPEFTDEHRTKRINNRHKQHGFVSVFLYNKRKREMYFEILKKTMNELETANEICLKISRKDIEKVFDAPDGFDIEHVVKQEDILFTMIREVFEETGLDIKRVSCKIKYFGFDKKILEIDGIVTHVFLVIFDSYDFIPYSKKKKKGNEVIAMNSYDILKKLNDDKGKEIKHFTSTIENIFEEVNSYCKPIRNEIILFGGPNSGLSEGVKGLGPDHLSIRDLYPEHYHARDEPRETQQMRILMAYNSIGKLLRGETKSDVGNEPIVIYERSLGCVNIFNRAYRIPTFPLNDLHKLHDSNQLDIHISPEDNEYAFTIANDRRSYFSDTQKAYKQTYELYEMFSHLEYPNKIIVKNDL